MTIAVVWQEDGRQWCAADTRLVVHDDKRTTDIATKIYSIPVTASIMVPGSIARVSYYRAEFGFMYAGAALPASMVAVTASTLLQKLVYPGIPSEPPHFEEVASFVCGLSKHFMAERRQHGGEANGIFSAAFFGWCWHSKVYKLAHINGRDDAGSFRVEMNYPPVPEKDGDPWLVFGSGSTKFNETLTAYRAAEEPITKRIPQRIIDKMVTGETDPAVGGATSVGAVYQGAFELFFAAEPITPGQPDARRIYNGLDLDTDVEGIGRYFVGLNGLA